MQRHAPYYIIIYSVSVPIFPYYLIKEMILGKEDIDHKMYFLSKNSFGNFFHDEFNEILTQVYACPYLKYPLLSPILAKHEFSPKFWKILKFQMLTKFVQWKPSFSMTTDGWTDSHDEQNIQFFRNLRRI